MRERRPNLDLQDAAPNRYDTSASGGAARASDGGPRVASVDVTPAPPPASGQGCRPHFSELKTRDAWDRKYLSTFSLIWAVFKLILPVLAIALCRNKHVYIWEVAQKCIDYIFGLRPVSSRRHPLTFPLRPRRFCNSRHVLSTRLEYKGIQFSGSAQRLGINTS